MSRNSSGPRMLRLQRTCSIKRLKERHGDPSQAGTSWPPRTRLYSPNWSASSQSAWGQQYSKPTAVMSPCCPNPNLCWTLFGRLRQLSWSRSKAMRNCSSSSQAKRPGPEAVASKLGLSITVKGGRNMNSAIVKREMSSTSTERVTSSKGFATVNPSTGEEIETFSFYGDAQIEKTLALAEQSFQTYRRLSVYKRAQFLSQLAEALRKNKTKLAKVITTE